MLHRACLVGLGLGAIVASVEGQGGVTPASCCLSPGTSGPCCIGQWDAVPYLTPISCAMPADPSCGGCLSDEIAHAALIPTGLWPDGVTPGGQDRSIAGLVLVWTRCAQKPGYTTHLWDPSDPGGVAYSPPILDRINADPTRTEDNPFCSGHAWILDDNKNPKLLTVGGEDHGDDNSATPEAFEDQDPNIPGIQNPCTGTSEICGLHKVYWFNPLAANPDNAWSDDPPDLHEGRWYPSVTTYLNSAGTEFLPTILGGIPIAYALGCDAALRYDHWWTLARPLVGAWTIHTATQLWQNYPRPFQIAGPSVLTAGRANMCEDDIPTNPFGGNPTSIITASQAWSAGPSPNPDDTTLTNATGGAWHYCNGAVLHTLNSLVYTEVNPEQRYNQDRILITGGSQQNHDGTNLVPAQPYTHELYGGQWRIKAAPVTPRVFSNWVVLPDGTLLLIGGASNTSVLNAGSYYSTIERFTPQGPQDSGYWMTMAPRPDVVVTPTQILPPPARGYHHVALLLQDGRVAV